MSKRRRIIAAVFAVLFAFAVVSSLMFIAHAAGHDCCGEDCPVCAALAAVCSSLKFLCAFVAVITAALASARAAAFAKRFSARLSAATPTALKVKLLN